KAGPVRKLGARHSVVDENGGLIDRPAFRLRVGRACSTWRATDFCSSATPTARCSFVRRWRQSLESLLEHGAGFGPDPFGDLSWHNGSTPLKPPIWWIRADDTIVLEVNGELTAICGGVRQSAGTLSRWHPDAFDDHCV